jgi:tRNA pseudouridine55 synthase
MRVFTALDGALVIDKPSGWTSHDVVAKIRGHFKLSKVGHCGTLDPMATGLLVLVLGQATRLSERLMSGDKRYEGTIRLGETTDSLDADGEILETRLVPLMTVDELKEYASSFLGDQHQTPPMVSAVKIDGVPLYKLARKGKEVERKPRLVHIYRFSITDYEEPFVFFDIICTKGTYVRVIADDFGKKIGCGAHLTRLRRTASGQFDIEQAHTLPEVLSWTLPELESRIVPMLELKQQEG